MFNNLGVAFPQGNCEEILHILENNDYMGWRSCSCEEAQRFSDMGVAAISMELDSIIIIYPNEKICNLSYDLEVGNIENVYVKHTKELSSSDCKNMTFFVYNYGHF